MSLRGVKESCQRVFVTVKWGVVNASFDNRKGSCQGANVKGKGKLSLCLIEKGKGR